MHTVECSSLPIQLVRGSGLEKKMGEANFTRDTNFTLDPISKLINSVLQ